MKIILASASPRRRELMELAGLPFETDVSDTDESIDGVMAPAEYVEELSSRKAYAVAGRHPEDIVIGADTAVVYRDIILGKPKDSEDAYRILKMLSGKTHSVYTGVTIVRPGNSREPFHDTFHVRTDVVMYDNPDDLLRDYACSGEPLDKAGAYGIQGKGSLLIERINGDYYNVVGLPIAELCRRLR